MGAAFEDCRTFSERAQACEGGISYRSHKNGPKEGRQFDISLKKDDSNFFVQA